MNRAGSTDMISLFVCVGEKGSWISGQSIIVTLYTMFISLLQITQYYSVVYALPYWEEGGGGF